MNKCIKKNYEYKTIIRRLSGSRTFACKIFKNMIRTFFGLKVVKLRKLKGFIEVECIYILKRCK